MGLQCFIWGYSEGCPAQGPYVSPDVITLVRVMVTKTLQRSKNWHPASLICHRADRLMLTQLGQRSSCPTTLIDAFLFSGYALAWDACQSHKVPSNTLDISRHVDAVDFEREP